MSQELRNLIADVEGVRKQVSKGKSVQVNSHREKEQLQQLIYSYFDYVRPSILSHEASSDFISELDTDMQDLLKCSHRKTTRSLIKKRLADLKKKLIQLQTDSLVLVPTGSTAEATNLLDRGIIETLQQLVPSAALSYEQALIDLAGPDRKSWRGPATDLREALRETLDQLAPDSDVTSQPEFKFEGDLKHPTMKQKVRFVLRTRGLSKKLSEPAEKAVLFVEATIGSFVRAVYNRSNVSTHTPTDRIEVLRVRDWVRLVFSELLEIR